MSAFIDPNDLDREARQAGSEAPSAEVRDEGQHRSPRDAPRSAESSPWASLRFSLKPAARRRVRLGRFARLFRLDEYGSTLLSRKVASSMEIVGYVFLAILLLESVFWTIRVQEIFTSRAFSLSWGTPFAAAVAFLVASIIVAMDRQIATMDTSHAARRTWTKMGLRILVVAGSAMLVHPSVANLLFRADIEQRLHAQDVVAEAVSRVSDLVEARGEADVAAPEAVRSEVKKSRQWTGLEDAEAQLAEATEKLRADRAEHENALQHATDAKQRSLEGERAAQDAAQERESKRKGYRWAKRKLERLPEHAPKSERKRLEKRSGWAYVNFKRAREAAEEARAKAARLADEHDIAVDRVHAAFGELKAQKQAVGDAEDRVEAREADLEAKFGNVRGRRESTEEAARARIDRVRSWIHAIRGLDFSVQSYTEDGASTPAGATPWVFERPQHSRTDYLVALDNLVRGRPIPVEKASAEVRGVLEQELPGVLPVAGEEAERDRLRIAESFSTEYWLLYGFFFVMPLLALVLKTGQSDEVAAYYSRYHQAVAGNPDALETLIVERKVRHLTEQRRRQSGRSEPRASSAPPDEHQDGGGGEDA